MKKIITAIGNPILNEELKKEINIEVLANDIQYQEGIFELLEKEKNIDFIILSENIKGENTVDELIEKIKLINKKIKIIIFLETSNEELENILIAKGVYKILYNNQIEIKDLIEIINEIKNNENEELKQEINNLKKLIIENQKINYEKTNLNQNSKNILNKKNNKQNQIQKKYFNFIQKINLFNFQNNKKIKENKKEIISISGPSGVGKSIITVNLAKSMMYKEEKILIIDFDVLGNNLHTILGVKKYPSKLVKELNDINKNNLEIEKLIIKINKKIDLISATNLLFGTKERIDLIKIENILKKLKEKYNTIIIDTSSECFFDFTKTIIKLSNKNIFVTETNILEIKKAKELLNIYINEWKIDKNKFNILFNKYDEDCISIELLKEIFCEFNIIGTLKYSSKYNKIINQNLKNFFIDKKIRKEYLEINKKINCI